MGAGLLCRHEPCHGIWTVLELVVLVYMYLMDLMRVNWVDSSKMINNMLAWKEQVYKRM